MKLKKTNFTNTKILIHDVDINKIVVFSKFPFNKKGFKYFIGYKNYYETIMPLCIMLLKINAYRRDFDENT